MTPNQVKTGLNGATHICLERRIPDLWPAMDGTDKDLGWEARPCLISTGAMQLQRLLFVISPESLGNSWRAWHTAP